MQISASNLLVAAQQPRSPSQTPQQLHSGFAQTLAKTDAGFEPMSFKPAQAGAQAAPQGGQSDAARAASAKPYVAPQAPGARLDIRI